jgi:hypothetical protein
LSTLLQKSQEAIGILYDEFGDDISIKPWVVSVLGIFALLCETSFLAIKQIVAFKFSWIKLYKVSLITRKLKTRTFGTDSRTVLARNTRSCLQLGFHKSLITVTNHFFVKLNLRFLAVIKVSKWYKIIDPKCKYQVWCTTDSGSLYGIL